MRPIRRYKDWLKDMGSLRGKIKKIKRRRRKRMEKRAAELENWYGQEHEQIMVRF
jgi:hypothetical protein